jgi:membrane protease YdiL (CAAX protease family)
MMNGIQPHSRPLEPRAPWRSLLPLIVLALLPFAVRWVCVSAGGEQPAWQWVYKVPLLMVPVLWRRYVGGHRGWSIFWPVSEPLPTWKVWLAGVAMAGVFAAAAIVLVTYLAPLLEIDPTKLRGAFDARFGLTPFKAVGIVLYLLSLNAGLEELHYRAWLDRELSARVGSAAGVLCSAMAFSGMHVFVFAGMPGIGMVHHVLMCVGLFAAGASWSVLMRQPGGIHAAWLSHGLTDSGLLMWGLYWLGYLGA